MSKTSVFCIANSRTQAAQIVDGLFGEGFSNNDISALFPDRDTSRDFAHEKRTKAPEDAATGVGPGGLVGGTLGWLADIGSLAIPGVGPLIAAGPIIAALSGAAVGGIGGGLIGVGIPEYEARRYEGKVKAGNILLSVHTQSSEAAAVAREVFKRARAKDIATSGESHAPEPKRSEDHPHYENAQADIYSSTRR